jgi:hypothetical protein
MENKSAAPAEVSDCFFVIMVRISVTGMNLPSRQGSQIKPIIHNSAVKNSKIIIRLEIFRLYLKVIFLTPIWTTSLHPFQAFALP